MSATSINNITQEEEARIKDIIRQIQDSTDKRYIFKPPVANTTVLKAIVKPVDGESRQDLSGLPNYLIRYVFNTSSTDGLLANDSTPGSWTKLIDSSKIPLDAKLVDPNYSMSPSPRALIDSRAGGLLTNGTGMLGGQFPKYGPSTTEVLYNFSSNSSTTNNLIEVLNDGNLLDGVGTGFTVNGSYCFIGTTGYINEIIAVNPNLIYKGGVSVISNQASIDNGIKLYCGHLFIDVNGYSITSITHQHYGLAKLAQDLNLGTDTWLYITRDGFEGNLDPHTEWKIGHTAANTYTLRRGLVFWDHHYKDNKVNENGDTIPFTATGNSNPNKPAGFGYSRHYIHDLWDNVDEWEQADDGTGAGNWNGYTNVWRHPIKTAHGTHKGYSYAPDATSTLVKEGTAVSHNWHGGTYKYCYAIYGTPTDPNKIYAYHGWIGGVDYSGSNHQTAFPPGSAGVKFLLLAHYGKAAGGKHHYSAMHMGADPTVNIAYEVHGGLPEHTKPKLKRSIFSSGTAIEISAERVTTIKNKVLL